MDDAPRLLPLFEAFYGAYFHPKTVEAIRAHMAAASDIDTVLLAEDRGVPVGFASLRILPQIESGVPHAELSDLYVQDRHRRRGIGRALVAFTETLAAEKGCARLTLITGFDNDAAERFYRSEGFEDFGRALSKPLRGGR